jgi:hypothetical protein
VPKKGPIKRSLTFLDDPITIEERRQAIQAGIPHKAPGPEGRANELYKTEWTSMKDELLRIMNEVYSESKIDDTQRHGSIACLPKCTNPQNVTDYRPLTLLNTDFKILNRIVSNHSCQVYWKIINIAEPSDQPSLTP